ncbi:hypothetical protein [Bacillus sp. T33-2]|uniref:hypothetical protein n=1 Tax=Bacillus sp. T33-2 TaxID=2054168 RepID=UPI000C79521E|nr:hypothetical protein [Bacillus sp. T33-2]PLR99586.1 hypothetical protein CVD19_00555 [Bacillus sp. T33-2]
MSWDITLIEKKLVEFEVADIGNYTYNVSKMYGAAMGKTMSDFHGMEAFNAVDILSKGFCEMRDNPEKYKAMNPSNGWGNYEGALQYLEKLLLACIENPNSIINVY